MAAVLEGEKKLKRLIRVHGIGQVEVTIEEGGISFRLPRTKSYVRCGWIQAVNACGTDTNVPSYLMGQPYELLKHNAKKAEERRIKSVNSHKAVQPRGTSKVLRRNGDAEVRPK